MPYTTDALNAMLDGLTVTHASLHTGDPGTTGVNEVTGGSYARQTLTMSAAVSGNRDSANQPSFDVLAGTTVSHFGVWNNTTFLVGGALPASETFGGDGEYVLSDVDLSLS